MKESELGALTLLADTWLSNKKFFEWPSLQSFGFEIEIRINRKLTYIDKKTLGSVGKQERFRLVADTLGVRLYRSRCRVGSEF